MSWIQTSLHGIKVGLDATGRLVTPGGMAAGEYGKQITMGGPSWVTLYDDFLGDVVADQWNFTEGTDSATSDGALVVTTNGMFRLTAGDSAGTVAGDGSQLNSELNWKASQTNLIFEARVKLAVITTVSCFMGFTDTKSLEQPIESANSANTLTANADDAVGFMFDTRMDADNWWAVGVKATTKATAQNLAVAPVADTYATFRVEVSSTGEARFYYNGQPIGTLMASAITATVALTPVFIIRPTGATAGMLMDIDYAHVRAARA